MNKCLLRIGNNLTFSGFLFGNIIFGIFLCAEIEIIEEFYKKKDK